MIVVDTTIVSELMRPRPSPAVVAWAALIPSAELAITSITVTEIEYGLARLPEGRRRGDLAERWRRVVAAYSDQLLAFTVEAARQSAEILASGERLGRPISLADAQIAGVCRHLSATLATHNTRDFEGLGLDMVDPFHHP